MASELARPLVVLDSWPVLEWIKKREPAFSNFRRLLERAAAQRASFEMTRINFGEVIYTIRKAPDIRDRDNALASFRALSIRVHSIDDALVDEAVELKSRYPFAYADAFAASLAIRLGVALVTGDREFQKLEADGLLALNWVGA